MDNSIKPIVRLVDSQKVISFLNSRIKKTESEVIDLVEQSESAVSSEKSYILNGIISKGSKLTAYKEILNYISLESTTFLPL
jgi:fructose-1-phosphate kinase PfkB-like protein